MSTISLWWLLLLPNLYQFSSVTQSCLTLWDPMDCSTPGLPIYHQLPEFTQTHVHWVGDAIQPSHPLSFPSPPAFNLSQHQSLFKWVSSSHQVAKVVHPFNGYNSMAFKHIHRVTISSLQSDLQHFHHPQKKLYPSAITLHSLSPLLLAMTFCLYRFTYSGDFI